ncbi:hypothetical protein FACS189472_09440 [Alphaproteobacteria bacterium]|nr:hypothetical protein FACS189472_09440 [Alphaproteobacteria bacterium]
MNMHTADGPHGEYLLVSQWNVVIGPECMEIRFSEKDGSLLDSQGIEVELEEEAEGAVILRCGDWHVQGGFVGQGTACGGGLEAEGMGGGAWHGIASGSSPVLRRLFHVPSFTSSVSTRPAFRFSVSIHIALPCTFTRSCSYSRNCIIC